MAANGRRIGSDTCGDCHPSLRRRISIQVRPYWRTLVPVIFLCATFAHATPIKPDLKRLLAQPAPKKQDFIPARAGWDGPELRTPSAEMSFTPESSSIRASLLAAAVPDSRVVFAIIVVILLLRRLRKASPDEAPASHLQPREEIPRAA